MKRIVFAAVLAWGSAAVAGTAPTALMELEAMADRPPAAMALGSEGGAGLGLRLGAVKEAAETLGIQRAIQYRYEQINQVLDRSSGQLDRIFDFSPLLMHNDKLLPPVITEANDVFTLKDNDSALSSDTTYEIKSEARIVTTAPSWRDYLIQHFSVNDQINPALVPKDTNEKVIWLDGVRRGWYLGAKQADSIFSANLARLVRDYRGIVRFHMLVAQHVVSMPVLAEGDMGIRVNGKMLDVGQKIFKITDHTRFTPDTEWKPLDFDPAAGRRRD